MNTNQENIIEGRENAKINALIYSIRYKDNSRHSITEIRSRIMIMVSISEKFTRDMEEATRSYKMESSKENSPKKEESPGKEESPKGTSPRVEGSKMNQEEIEKRLEELRESEDQDVERWNTASENLMDDDEMEKLRLDLELRRLRRMERTRSAGELESIKSEENPYSSLGSLSPIELVEIGMDSPLDEKLV